MSQRPETVGPVMEKWFVVDNGRIASLPERLKALWPHELLPETAEREKAAATTRATVASAGEDSSSATTGTASADGSPAASAGEGEIVSGKDRVNEAVPVVLAPAARGASRELDVLSAWLAGFAAELGLSRSRMTIVISSGAEIAHLAVCLGGDIGRSILSLRGEGFEEFAGYQLLRRVGIRDLGRVVDDLSSLVEGDCVLTLTYLTAASEAGMEFLHRVDGAWFRPVIEQVGGSITVGAEAEAGRRAVPALLTSVLTLLWTSTLGGQP